MGTIAIHAHSYQAAKERNGVGGGLSHSTWICPRAAFSHCCLGTEEKGWEVGPGERAEPL